MTPESFYPSMGFAQPSKGFSKLGRGSPVLWAAAASPPSPRARASDTHRPKCRTDLMIGSRLDGGRDKYTLEAVLGSGCFAEVYRAQCRRSKVTVAIKVMPEDGEHAQWFHQKEAQRLLSLHHPSIIAAVETFRFVAPGRAFTCITMEYCGGGTLLDHIRTASGPLPAPFINHCAWHLADALDYLNTQGVIHGDLKSDNVLMTRGQQPKLTDFGHSRRVPVGDATVPPMQGGDLTYAPPEHCEAQNLWTAYDWWGLGCILGEMAVGTPLVLRSPDAPFVENADALEALITDLRQIHHGAYASIVQRLCARDPEKRLAPSAVRREIGALGGVAPPRDNVDGAPHTTTTGADGRAGGRLHRLLHRVKG